MINSLNSAVRLGLASALFSLAAGCSTSAFTGQGSSSKPQPATSTAQTAPAASANAAATSSSAPAGSSATGNAGGQAFANSFAAVSATDASTVGCSLPANVAAAMKGYVTPVTGKAALALGASWGGASSQASLGLKNLDLSSCEWFQAMKTSPDAHYMVVFTDDKAGQSYAQPFSLTANAITYAACISAGALASASVGGTVACDYVPAN